MSDEGEELIRKWVQETAAKYCKDCTDTCCNGIRHRIDIEESKIEPFLKKGIPIFRIDELKEEYFGLGTFSDFHQDKSYYTLNGDKIPKPALIQIGKPIPSRGRDAIFSLYVDKYCPLYDEGNNRCSIHDNPQRPDVCIKYPLFEIISGDFTLKDSCKPFNKREVREDFRKKFREPEYSLLINEANGRYTSFVCGKTLNEVEYGTKV